MTVFADIIYGKTQSGSTIYANRDVSFSVEKGELAIILGSSGAEKSTVLNILGEMDTNDSGKVIIDGKDISKYTRNQLTAYRRTDVGFVFQFYNLVQNLTAKENVELASEIVDNALDPVQCQQLKRYWHLPRIKKSNKISKKMMYKSKLKVCAKSELTK